VLRKNILRYVNFSRMFLQNVKCLRYGKLRYVTWGWKTRISLSSVIMRWLQHAQAYVKYSKVNVNLYRALSCSTSKALRYGPCVTRGSHSFTCQPHTNLIFAFTPTPSFGLYPLRLPRRDGQAELTWVTGYLPR